MATRSGGGVYLFSRTAVGTAGRRGVRLDVEARTHPVVCHRLRPLHSFAPRWGSPVYRPPMYRPPAYRPPSTPPTGVTCCVQGLGGVDDMEGTAERKEGVEGTDGVNTDKLEVVGRRGVVTRRRDVGLEDARFRAEQRLRVPKKDSVLRIRAHRPIWTYVIIAMNMSIIIFQKWCAYWGSRGGVTSLIVSPSLQALGAKVSTKILSGELWRLVTAAFLHVNTGHLLLNSYALYALGSATEILFGSGAFMAIYMAGAVGGNMFSVCAATQSCRPSVGSSGGVFALIAAMCVHLERNRLAIGPVARGNLRAVVTATIVNLVGGWVMPSVDGWAHFGGCVYGAVMATCLAPKVVLHRAQDGRLCFVEVRRVGGWACWMAWVVAASVSIAVILAVRVISTM